MAPRLHGSFRRAPGPVLGARARRAHRAVGVGVVVLALAGAGVGALTDDGPAARAPAPVAAAFDMPQAVDTSSRAVPSAARSASRATTPTRGPRLLPAPTAKDASCRLDLGYGTWAIDFVAARTLSMLTTVAYRDGRDLTRAARAFERQLRTDGRTPMTAERAEKALAAKRNKSRPRTTSLDAVLALFRPHTLFCAQPLRSLQKEEMLTNGLTPRAQSLLFAFFEAYGGRPLGGFAPGGIASGHIEDSAHYDGRAVDVFFSLDDPDNNARGWLLAHWLVTHADFYQIETLIFDDLVWTRSKSGEGWRPYVHPSGDIKNVTLRHLDHIHVDVVHGFPEDEPTAEPTPGAPGAPGSAPGPAPAQAPAGGAADPVDPAPAGQAPAGPAAPAPPADPAPAQNAPPAEKKPASPAAPPPLLPLPGAPLGPPVD